MRSLYGLSYSCLWVSPQTLPRPAGFVYFYTPPDGIFTHFSLTVPCIHIGYARQFPGRPYSRRMHQWVEAAFRRQPPSPRRKHVSMHVASPGMSTGWVASPAFASYQRFSLGGDQMNRLSFSLFFSFSFLLEILFSSEVFFFFLSFLVFFFFLVFSYIYYIPLGIAHLPPLFCFFVKERFVLFIKVGFLEFLFSLSSSGSFSAFLSFF